MLHMNEQNAEKRVNLILNGMSNNLGHPFLNSNYDLKMDSYGFKTSPDINSVYENIENRVFHSPNPLSLFQTPVHSISNNHQITPNQLASAKSYNLHDDSIFEINSTYSNPNLHDMFIEESHNEETQDQLKPFEKDYSNSKFDSPDFRNESPPNRREVETREAQIQKYKNNRGLKLLSVTVREIVSEKQSTTYKEVADTILKEMLKCGNTRNGFKTDANREEQNVKRRVYDALNVLISAGVLTKDGKKVRKSSHSIKVKMNDKRTSLGSLYAKIVS